MILLLLACAADPDPCASMCASANDLYGGCLEDWGLTWSAAGYDDAAAHLESCETWAWEMRRLEVEAGEPGATDETCREWQSALSAPDATCETYTNLEWNTPPWEQR